MSDFNDLAWVARFAAKCFARGTTETTLRMILVTNHAPLAAWSVALAPYFAAERLAVAA